MSIDFQRWVRQTPGATKENGDGPLTRELGGLEVSVRDAGIESVGLPNEALEALMWESGYEGQRFPSKPPYPALAKVFKMNLKKIWEEGAAEGTQARSKAAMADAAHVRQWAQHHMQRKAKADVLPIRQRTQYSCMSASMAMCLRALGHEVTEDEVNRVMGARPMKGAAWEQALATAQHYGCRATLTMPSTVEQLKKWTDSGTPIMIAWNPEGRPWSHASVVFDVTEDLPNPLPENASVISDKAEGGLWVWVADPNIPNPKKTIRIVSENDFYGKWYEKFPDYLVRRPACAIEREITVDGVQKMASTSKASSSAWEKAEKKVSDIRSEMIGTRADIHEAEEDGDGPNISKNLKKMKALVGKYRAAQATAETACQAFLKEDETRFLVDGWRSASKKESPITGPGVTPRNPVVQGLIERGQGGAGRHKDRGRDYERGNARKPKHPNQNKEAVLVDRVLEKFARNRLRWTSNNAGNESLMDRLAQIFMYTKDSE